ncbi:uncharacterized protein LOC129723815 [Wyeomyia smithii]|uniref:uncharacterized protein LOC129723815 n=1 Tax=Wyeomyia smithii TaxID=174621 RepID=UPI002467FF5B|nr:uncharacterized protein LOC129723815 [Wyeomyia smithii]
MCKMATSWTVPFAFFLVVYTYILLGSTNSFAGEAKKSTSFHHPENSFDDDDELIPVDECSQRSRDWTLRCLVPVTNFQMAIDLCGTKQKPAKNFIKQCLKQLTITGKSCPQLSMMETASAMARNGKPPPAPSGDYRSKTKQIKSPLKGRQFQVPKSLGGKRDQSYERDSLDL